VLTFAFELNVPDASKNNLQTLGDKTVDFEHPHHQSTADEDFGSTGGQPSNSHPLIVHGATSQTKNYKSFCKSITIDAHMHPPLSMFIVNGISADVGPVIMDESQVSFEICHLEDYRPVRLHLTI